MEAFLVILILSSMITTILMGYRHLERENLKRRSKTKSIVDHLHHAVQKSSKEKYLDRCISILKKHPSLVNAPLEPYGFTPFLRACMVGKTDLVKFMLDNGADITKRTSTDAGPLYLATYAIAKNHSSDCTLISLLLDAGCKINAAKRTGFTPLHVAARYGNEDLIRWLLVNGADPEPSENSLSPYEVAKMYDHRGAAKLLKVDV